MIKLEKVTMKYANGKGIFDVDFEVREGEVVGFLGPNGAGKTTTIRCLLGFAKAQNGTCTVNGLECFSNAPKIAKDIGFIAGEPAFPDGMTGLEYLNYLCETRKRDVAFDMKKKMHELIDYFEFDPKGKIKRMSKGMKQKTAIVGAFLHDPKVYIFDEPTSGLDPIMQSKFIDLVLAEKKRGKTILMSSHMFEEIERASDYVVIIKGGRIVAKDKVATLKNLTSKVFIVNGEEVTVPNTEVDKFVKQIAKKKVESLDVKQVSLESIFMKYYEDKEGAKK